MEKEKRMSCFLSNARERGKRKLIWRIEVEEDERKKRREIDKTKNKTNK